MKNYSYRIVHLAKYYPPTPGGIETHVQTLAQTQASLGADVHVVCVNGLDEKGHLSQTTKTVREIDNGVRVTRLGRLACLARFDLCPELPKTLYQLLDKSNTLLHLHTPNPTMLTALTILPKRGCFVVTHHSDIIRQRILKYALRPFEHLVYSQASLILTDSPNYIKGSKFLRLYKQKVDCLPLGLDCSSYVHPWRSGLTYARTLKQQFGEPIWLAVGRLVYYKALHIAIEALASVRGTLVIVGTGPLERQLKDKATELGLEGRIIWLGQATPEQLIGAYHAATALWFPSNVRSEGFGLVQVEAMASGCPVINANIPGSGVPWVSRHEQEGLTVPINDPVALAAAAQRLLEEPGLRDRLSIASRQRAKSFDNLTMAKQSISIYDEAWEMRKKYRFGRNSGRISKTEITQRH